MTTVRPRRGSPVAEFWSNLGEGRVDPLLSAMDAARGRGQRLWGKERGYFKPSYAGTVCERAVTFESAGHETPWEPRMLRVFGMGSAVEAMAVEDLREAGLLLESNVEVSGDGFWGFADVVVRDPRTGERLLGEIKSINDNRYRRLPRPADDPRANARNLAALQRDYLAQWNVYARAAGIRRGFLLFENKNNSERRLYRLELDPALLAEVDAVHGRAADHVRRRELAPVPADRRPAGNDRVCRGCRHLSLCVAAAGRGVAAWDDVRRLDRELRGDGGGAEPASAGAER